MHKRHKYDLITFLAIAAFGVSLYLTVTHYLQISVPCSITHGCETVLHSKYSEFFGFPTSLWGAVYFVGVIFVSLMANHYNAFRRLLTFMLTIGALVSLALLSLQFFVIGKVCQYCLTVDVISLFIFLWDLNVEGTIPFNQ